MKASIPVLLVAIGGMVGALARYGLSGFVQGNRVGFPIGTLVVNLLGCFIMGLLARWLEVGIARPELRYLLGLGFLGAFTTFSTFSFEAIRLFMDHNATTGMLYIVSSLFGCLATVTAGYVIARAVWA
jgi:CrcB protein